MKYLIVDDHELFRAGLTQALNVLDSAPDIFSADSLAAAEAILESQKDLDLVLLDMGLPDARGVDGLLRLKANDPLLPVVIVSASEEGADIQSAMELGALGFIPKTSGLTELVNALRQVVAGDIYVPPAYDHSVGEPGIAQTKLAQLQQLTQRQREVLHLVMKGYSNKDICRELNIAEPTVKIHIQAIYRTLNVKTRTQAILAISEVGYSPVL